MEKFNLDLEQITNQPAFQNELSSFWKLPLYFFKIIFCISQSYPTVIPATSFIQSNTYRFHSWIVWSVVKTPLSVSLCLKKGSKTQNTFWRNMRNVRKLHEASSTHHCLDLPSRTWRQNYQTKLETGKKEGGSLQKTREKVTPIANQEAASKPAN